MKEDIVKNRPITKFMVKRLHVIYGRLGMTEEEYRAIIRELTDGRTDSTKGLTLKEAYYLAGYLFKGNTVADDITRKLRGGVLKRTQRLGIDTTDWARVNAFLEDRRIAGKRLYEMTQDELQACIIRLEMIIKKEQDN